MKQHETGLITNLNVFTGHIFHHSREEIWCIFTSGDHLRRKHTPETKRVRISQGDIFEELQSFVREGATFFKYFIPAPFHAFPSLSSCLPCRDDDWRDGCGASEGRLWHRLWIFNSWLHTFVSQLKDLNYTTVLVCIRSSSLVAALLL